MPTFDDMQIKIRAFGIAKDILDSSTIQIEVKDGITIGQLKDHLINDYPNFERLRSLAFAINEAYVTEQTKLNANDEVILIPPVSGG